MIVLELRNGRKIVVANRAELPEQAVTFTPGYSWSLEMDVKFDGERPIDWPDWIIRMHIWAGTHRLTLINDNGVTFEEVSISETEDAIIPVIRMTADQTATFASVNNIHYVIDMKAPDADAEDYFAGIMSKSFGPPLEMLE